LPGYSYYLIVQPKKWDACSHTALSINFVMLILKWFIDKTIHLRKPSNNKNRKRKFKVNIENTEHTGKLQRQNSDYFGVLRYFSHEIRN
jgi:hypothetical protein